jgi:phosphohistidine phosphatase
MIWLLRHGDAEDADGDDDARQLTDEGKRQAEAAGRALEALDAGIGACLASPKVRARDMARIACRGLGVEPEETELLRGGGFDPQEVAGPEASAAGPAGNVLLVGHEPDLSQAIQAATGASVKLKKGGLAAIEDGALIALLTPAQLAAIAAAR